MSCSKLGLRWSALLAAGLVLSGCVAITPDPVQAVHAPPANWVSPLPHGGDEHRLDAWWQTFHDTALAALQQAAQRSNPDLDRAVAAIRRARADLVIARSGAQPQLGLQSTLSRSGDVRDRGYTLTSTSHTLDASWETDLFGRIRQGAAALQSEAEARGADWHSARVSLAAEVATTYADYRACRQRSQAYRDQDASYRKTLAITRTNVSAGFTSPADYRLTSAGASSAAANVTAEDARCETLVKSLVALTGLPEAEVQTLLGGELAAMPTPAQFSVDSVPANLLRQRPDLAAADRRLAAAYARIAASQAARWPDLTLTGSIGVAHTALAAPSPWSLAANLALPLYSAGGTAARVDAARADYDGVLADYDALVRRAVQEVEVALVNLDGAARREQDVVASADNYRAYFQAAEIDWKAGRLPLLDLETARRNALTAELLTIDVRSTRIDQWIALYKALGGGWDQTLDVATPLEKTP